MQSPFSEMTQRNWSLKGHEDLCFLDLGCLQSKCNMVLTVLFASEMGYNRRKYNLKLYFRVTSDERNILCGLLILLKMKSG